MRVWLATLIAIGFSSAGMIVGGEPAFRSEPSLAAARGYLERRADWWMSWKNAQRENGTVCMSCHTTMPYMLAEAALSKHWATTNGAPRMRVVESVRTRTINWNTIESYHHSGDPNTKSTECILNLAILVSEDIAEDRKEISRETRKAFANLWSLQVKDGPLSGAWQWYDYNLAPWEEDSAYFGAALAAAALGDAPGYVAGMSSDEKNQLNSLRAYLKNKIERQNLHDQLTAVWASRKLSGFMTKARRRAIAKTALAMQNADGGWSAGGLGTWKRSDGKPQSTASDSYGTALVLASLKGVVEGGQRPAIERGFIWLQKHQQAVDGSWAAESLNTAYAPGDAAALFMRDAATAWAVLALTE